MFFSSGCFGVSLTGWTLANLGSGPGNASPRLGQGKGSPQPLTRGCAKGARTGGTSVWQEQLVGLKGQQQHTRQQSTFFSNSVSFPHLEASLL